jgi:hypothetical protein
MSKNPRPTSEEYRFIYDQLLKNGGDIQSVLSEYAYLFSLGQLVFPYRTDARLIKEAAKQLEAAGQVLEEHIKKRVDPVISQRRQEHFEHLADIANSLLSGGLKDISEGYDPDNHSTIYVILDHYPDTDVAQQFTLKGLIERLQDNLALTRQKFGDWDVMDCFQSHLKAESSDVESKGIEVHVGKNPLELIATLRILSSRKVFKGICPVCKDW